MTLSVLWTSMVQDIPLWHIIGLWRGTWILKYNTTFKTLTTTLFHVWFVYLLHWWNGKRANKQVNQETTRKKLLHPSYNAVQLYFKEYKYLPSEAGKGKKYSVNWQIILVYSTPTCIYTISKMPWMKPVWVKWLIYISAIKWCRLGQKKEWSKPYHCTQLWFVEITICLLNLWIYHWSIIIASFFFLYSL